MCIIKEVFYYDKTKLPVIKYKDEIWVKANTVANFLRYKNTIKSIQERVEPEGTIYISKSLLCSLILCSKLESAQVFISDGQPKRYCHPLERQEDTVMMT